MRFTSLYERLRYEAALERRMGWTAEGEPRPADAEQTLMRSSG